MVATDNPTPSTPLYEETIYTVSQLNALARELLEGNLQHMNLIGEISNLVRPSSGHFYFTLKDQFAQVRCALFRSTARRLSFTPENGLQVLITAQVSLYETRGEFQLIIGDMQVAGDGILQLAFEKLKQNLAAQGLFDSNHKKLIPPFIKTVGVITSSTGAAIRDILHVLKRRCPAIAVVIYPTLVQGANAKDEIVKAISKANARNECDVLILARGGGSLEDLWPFNEESVAQAIFNSTLPIMTGIGHETDFTIADFVADCRAPTPSSAAELISPDLKSWVMQLQHLFYKLYRHQRHKLQHEKQNLQVLSRRLRHPRTELKDIALKLDHYQKQLALMLSQHLAQQASLLNQTRLKLLHHSPKTELDTVKSTLKLLTTRLINNAERFITNKHNTLRQQSQQLTQLSPLQTLSRGYAIATHDKTHALIRHAHDINVGEQVKITLSHGHLYARITKKTQD